MGEGQVKSRLKVIAGSGWPDLAWHIGRPWSMSHHSSLRSGSIYTWCCPWIYCIYIGLFTPCTLYWFIIHQFSRRKGSKKQHWPGLARLLFTLEVCTSGRTGLAQQARFSRWKFVRLAAPWPLLGQVWPNTRHPFAWRFLPVSRQVWRASMDVWTGP